MPTNAEQQELLRVQGIYRSIHAIIQSRYKGLVVSKFSQAIEPVSALLHGDQDLKDRFGQALVNRWIAAHAAEGSLWDEVYPNVKGQTGLDLDALRGLVAELERGGGDRDGSTWLMERGMVARMTITSGPDPNLGLEVLDALSRAGQGSYAVIHVKRRAGVHVMCAHLGASSTNEPRPYRDVAFFDPNVGELWFDHGESFARFFVYLGQVLYEDCAGFQIRAFGKRATFAAPDSAEREGFEPSVGF